MTINILAGFEAARNLPVGQGVMSHSVPGFGIYMISNHDDADTFTLALKPLFAPADTPNDGVIAWESLTVSEAMALLAATITFAESHFGDLADLDDAERELIDDIESFLSD